MNRGYDSEFRDIDLRRLYHHKDQENIDFYRERDIDDYFKDPENWDSFKIKADPGCALPVKDYYEEM